jgi:hypothetical protein
MLKNFDKLARRVFAWPIVLVGAVVVESGGLLIRFGAWLVDIDTEGL